MQFPPGLEPFADKDQHHCLEDGPVTAKKPTERQREYGKTVSIQFLINRM